MNNMIWSALLTTLLALTVSIAPAQSTNVVQRANFALKGTTQTSLGATSVRISNKDILAALNATGAYNFGPGAVLLFVSSDDQPPLIIVREGSGGQTTNTDVSDYFGVTEIGDEIRSRDDNTRWETWHFAFDNGNTNGETGFELWGSTTIHRGSIRAPNIATIAGPQRVESSVRGVGRLQGAVTIFSGTVSAAKSVLEEEP